MDQRKPISAIQCNAKNCKYNNGENDCFAKGISVGPNTACSSEQTSCGTFAPKQ